VRAKATLKKSAKLFGSLVDELVGCHTFWFV
jgi:hypothetical protein